jgi:hypothetical protein
VERALAKIGMPPLETHAAINAYAGDIVKAMYGAIQTSISKRRVERFLDGLEPIIRQKMRDDSARPRDGLATADSQSMAQVLRDYVRKGGFSRFLEVKSCMQMPGKKRGIFDLAKMAARLSKPRQLAHVPNLSGKRDETPEEQSDIFYTTFFDPPASIQLRPDPHLRPPDPEITLEEIQLRIMQLETDQRPMPPLNRKDTPHDIRRLTATAFAAAVDKIDAAPTMARKTHGWKAAMDNQIRSDCQDMGAGARELYSEQDLREGELSKIFQELPTRKSSLPDQVPFSSRRFIAVRRALISGLYQAQLSSLPVPPFNHCRGKESWQEDLFCAEQLAPYRLTFVSWQDAGEDHR